MVYLKTTYFIIMVLPLILAANTTNVTVTYHNSSNINLTNYSNHHRNLNSSITLLTEGGTLVTESVGVTLPKSNNDELLKLDEEFPKLKITAVKPRKGALLPKEDEPLLQTNTTIVEESKVNMTAIKINNINKTSVNVTASPKKPTILRSEELAKAGAKYFLDNKVVSNVIGKVYVSSGKSKIVNPNKNPGIVIPIVITILVVPAFAVLGYLAVKRGKDAWKNRHYKRMDFLLDGMYND